MEKKAHVIYITGGQRSGKSRYAQQLASGLSSAPVYLATSRIWDDDFQQRVDRHKNDRGPEWKTIEEEKTLSAHDFHGKTVVLDCITLWLTNLFFDNRSGIESVLGEAKNEFNRLISQKCTLLVISNEIGMGGHGATEIQRKFTDLQGWMNQYIASLADEAYLMVSGIPVRIK